MATNGATADRSDPINNVKISVKFNGRSIPINLSVDSTVKDLKYLLQPLTDVLPRGQKLISKGKILDDEEKFSSLGTYNGIYKLQLIASQGLHQGSGPIKNETTVASNLRRVPETGRREKQVTLVKSQSKRWKLTGVIALSNSDVKVIPHEVWNCGSSIRFLDLNCNSIQDIPEAIGGLSSLQKLLLNANCIKDEFLSWKGISSLKSLSFLSLSQNLLTSLPSDLGALTTLKELHVANNQLTCLPDEIGLLLHLEVLEANDNRIRAIPSCIGNCSSLVEADLSSNLLVELPETFSSLRNLKALHLHNNGLKSLPSTLLKNCTHLSTLDLHGTEITMDMLREFEGWESFDERRVLKHSKQLAFRVKGASYFDEGADKR
ncbi:LRR repeats and ubiquitin-like domain-containing protein At2g30105 [Cynara cardunculus var. scolymus]|uniref:LRR repeats and ubiquitin-like domain-containing protein At2g30105 n=1 Tax=Cynara cardunculus var. scolymus TaxID=59895 RepID=UPI000D62F446|nr:LRR repeats and ubiquitin-like domain-containing protein At2g30105 [Cynara cardunculus var. scolymus]